MEPAAGLDALADLWVGVVLNSSMPPSTVALLHPGSIVYVHSDAGHAPSSDGYPDRDRRGNRWWVIIDGRSAWEQNI